ncbi:MAG: DegV family protein [Eubacteriaceae bacterium]|nr:DegV family protein [Eubacteriaceae bacterium]
MVKFLICSDSDIPVEHIQEHGIDLLPLIVEIDDVEYRAYRDISGAEFRDRLLKSKAFPKTATISIFEIAEKMREYIENGDELIFITMTSKGSGTFNSARIAIEQLEEEYSHELAISVVDSKNFSIAYLHPVYDAAKMAAEGASRSSIVNYLESAYEKQHLILIMPDLKYLWSGGRINLTSAVVGGVIGIVPILHCNDGALEPLGKERGMGRALGATVRYMEEKCPSKKLGKAQIVHWNREKEAEQLKGLICSAFEVEEFLPAIHPEASVTAHAGVDFLAVAFS